MSNRGRYIAYAKKMREIAERTDPDNRPSVLAKLEAQQAKIRKQQEIAAALKEAMGNAK